MSEQGSTSQNPFEQLGPEAFEPVQWDRLSDDITRQLTAPDGPGLVTEPVIQREFQNAQELIPDYPDGSPGHTGLTHYFSETPWYSETMRTFPVYRRFEIIYPDLAQYLRNRMSSMQDNAPRELHPELFAAYRIMRHLVDKNDPYIIRKDGSIDEEFLIR